MIFTMYTKFRYMIIYMLLSLMLLNNAGCYNKISLSPPEEKAKDLINSIFSGEARKVLDNICIIESGIVLVMAVDVEWKNDQYIAIVKDENRADIQVKGRVIYTAEDVQKIFDQLAKSPPKVGIGGQVNIFYEELTVIKDGEDWCVPEDSLNDFYGYLVDLILEETERMID